MLGSISDTDRPVLVFDGAMGTNLDQISYYRNIPLNGT
ncbi:hypothetical protein GM3709_1163 [Geminocystis sp. NIES-3709]|nr:hypothetical protein GM3709_1163 [Geminocystis sp. NIES-3709]